MVNQKVVLAILRKKGYLIEVANDGREALDKLKVGRLRPDPDGCADACARRLGGDSLVSGATPCGTGFRLSQ